MSSISNAATTFLERSSTDVQIEVSRPAGASGSTLRNMSMIIAYEPGAKPRVRMKMTSEVGPGRCSNLLLVPHANLDLLAAQDVRRLEFVAVRRDADRRQRFAPGK